MICPACNRAHDGSSLSDGTTSAVCVTCVAERDQAAKPSKAKPAPTTEGADATAARKRRRSPK